MPIAVGVAAVDVSGVEPNVLDPLYYEREVIDGAAGELGVMWESRYVLEGRDALGGTGILGTTLDLRAGGLVGGVWLGNGHDGNYSELNVFGGFEKEFGPVTLGGAVQWLRFEPDGAEDWEVSVGAIWELGGGFAVAGDAVYSAQAEGTFLEFHCEYLVPHLPEDFEVACGVTLGNNQGYVPDGHDGFSHTMLTVSATYAFTESVGVSGYVAHTWGIDARVGEGLEDFFFGGIGVVVSF